MWGCGGCRCEGVEDVGVHEGVEDVATRCEV